MKSVYDSENDVFLSEALEAARAQIYDARKTLEQARHVHGWADRFAHVEGLLTCGLVTLSHSKKEIVKFEIKSMDHDRGPSLSFQSRGIGYEAVPGCFVCGSRTRTPEGHSALHNIAAFVKSKDDGEIICDWFGNMVRLDYRLHEPNWIQVKVGACDTHRPWLEKLHNVTSRHGVIRQQDIMDIRNESIPPQEAGQEAPTP